MIIIAFYDEIKEIEQIPEKYEDFLEIISNLYAIDVKEIDNLILEYCIDGKNYIILNKDTYSSLYSSGKTESTVNIYFSMEESKAYYQEAPKNEEKHEVIKNNKNINENGNENINNEVKSGEITKDMVIASIVKQVKENMQRSKILLKKKEEEEKRREEEERIRREKEEKGVSDQINNLITDKLNNLKNELINDSIIKYSQLLSESQINLKNMSKGNRYDENKEKINSLEEHPEISCSECGISPIVGNRYCCVYCQNLNYCEKCEEKNGFNHGHPLYKFKLRIV
jgi:hypothetical protein